MNDELRVEYPCDPALRSVGRVAVIGVLLRLRMPMMAVEQFRGELDAALAAVAGSCKDPGAILSVHVRWAEADINVIVTGPEGVERLSRPRIHR